MLIEVFPFIKLSKDSWTIFSFTLSKADVASSKSKIYGFLKMALAIAILCF